MSGDVFFSITATAAATLVGLLFVALQLTASGLTPGLLLRRHAMARSTFSLFSILFALSLYFVAFGKADQGQQAAVLVAAAALGIFRAIRTWLPVWREMIHGRLGTRIWQTAWLLIGPVLAFLYLGFVGLRNLHPTAHSALDIQLGTASTFIGLFVVSLRNSWNLLVEVSPIAEAGPPR
jgi:hypothetical protein